MTKKRDNWPDRATFFDDGIRFECIRCGACCTGDPGTVYLAREEVPLVARFLGMSEKAFIARHLIPYRRGFTILEQPDGRCDFFENGCAIYPVRPRQCRTFPFWLDNMRSEKRWESVAKTCPGIGRGPLYDKEAILASIHESLKDR